MNNNESEKGITLIDIINLLWIHKTVLIIVTTIAIITSITYSLLAEKKYDVTCVIKPAELSNEISLSNLSSSLSGFSLMGDIQSPISVEITETIYSKDFQKILYEKYKEEPKLFKDYLIKSNFRNKNLSEKLRNEAKFETALKIFENIIKVDVRESSIALTIRLHDKYFAKDFLNDILSLIKNYIRERNIKILEEDIQFYRNRIKNILDPQIRNKLELILANKINKSSILSTNLFSITESPIIPFKRVVPKRSIIVIISTIGGFFIGCLFIFMINFYKTNKNKLFIIDEGQNRKK